MSTPEVEARLAALEAKMGWRAQSPFSWQEMHNAPTDRDILLTIQEQNGLAVRVCFFQPHNERKWRSITGQRISAGCALAWMPLPEPYKKVNPLSV